MSRPPGVGPALAGRATPGQSVDRLQRRLFAPVELASVAVFRMIFGAIVVWEVYRYFSKGWIERY